MYSYYNSIKRTCSVCAGFHQYLLVLTVMYVKKGVIFYCFFLKIVFHWQNGLFQKPVLFFYYFILNITMFYFSYLSSIDINTIENHVHPFRIIVDRDQGFILFHWSHFAFTNKGLVRKKIVGVWTWKLRMEKWWMLDVIIH